MFNALNALSEDNSLLTVPPTRNPWLLAAMAVSFGLHFLIVYVPPLASLFSLPVVLIDEALKLAGRGWWRRENARRWRLSSGAGAAAAAANGGKEKSVARRGRSPARKNNGSGPSSSSAKAGGASPRRTRGSSKSSA